MRALHPGFVLVQGERTWPVEELRALAAAWASDLRSAGVVRHEPVAVATEAPLPFVLAFLALRSFDASVVPLSARLSGSERARLLRDAGVRLLLREGVDPGTDPGVHEALLPRPEEPLRIPKLAGEAPRLGPTFLLYTSGSEGAPKGVLHNDAAFLLHARAVAERLEQRPGDRWLASLPMGHVGALALLTRCLTTGAGLVLPDAELPANLDPLITAHGITHVPLVPTQLKRWLDERGGAPAPPSLRVVLLGGAAANADLLDRARSQGIHVRSTYGLTEAASQVATSRADSPPGSVGPGLAGVEVRILDDAGRPRPPGEEGRIAVRGPTLLVGYHRNPELTRASFREGWFVTQDLGRLDERGNLWVTGRLGTLIHTGGLKVDPAEVEAVLEAHPGVREAGVVGRPDPEWGEAVTALVVPRPGARLTAAELESHMRAGVAGHKRPKRYEFVERLPRTGMGKLDRTALKALASSVDDAHVDEGDAAR